MLAVRPEKTFLTADKPENLNALPAKVLHLVYVGTSTNYILEPVVGERISVFTQNKSHKASYAVNDKVYVAWDADSTFILDE